MTLETSTAVASGPTSPGGVARLNNISELRLLFASSVMLSHAATLIDADAYRLLRMVLNSDSAVQGFFILSGYLVFGSYGRLRDLATFYQRRLARLFPGYAAAVLVFTALALTQALALGAEVAWNELPRFLAVNLATLNFLQPTIGGVFADNPLTAVNGALWSIKVELMFYAVLPLLFVIGRRISFVALAVAMIVAGTLWWPVLSWLGDRTGIAVHPSLRLQLPGQLHYFGLGIILYARAKGLASARAVLLTIGLAVALLALLAGLREAFQALVLMLIIGGVSLLPQARDLFGGRDLSYGIYLAHFPIIQILIAAGAGALPFVVYLAAVVVLAVGYAMLSWRFIEAPALAWSTRRQPGLSRAAA